jgi:hypothetical protein
MLVRLPRNQALGLQGTDDLRGHHHVGVGVIGQFALTRLTSVRDEPPGAGQEHELNVRQVHGPQGSGHLSLPA